MGCINWGSCNCTESILSVMGGCQSLEEKGGDDQTPASQPDPAPAAAIVTAPTSDEDPDEYDCGLMEQYLQDSCSTHCRHPQANPGGAEPAEAPPDPVVHASVAAAAITAS
eukprot:SAG22_NODE_5668_length_975_cov_0.722603_2_plen_111_part_00